MTWTGFNIKGQYKCLAHLQTNTIQVDVDGAQVSLHISYGHHCFTDSKENGPMLFKRDERYWCEERYEMSKDLPGMIEQNLVNAYAVPHYHATNNEQYHYMEAYDYAIFFNITKPQGTADQLKIRVVSAYPLEEWGKDMIPKGTAYKVRWILSKRLKGENVLD